MKSVFAAFVALSAVTAFSVLDPATAQPAFPPPPSELGPMGPPPGPPASFVVEPGHWQWTGNRYVWIHRHWMPMRVGYSHFIPGHWGRSGRWIPAHWGP